jgi:hypothetical protein
VTTDLLRRTLGSIVNLPHPGRMLEGDAFRAWLDDAGLVHGKVSLATGAARGFDKLGMGHVAKLAKKLREKEPRYRRGVGASAFIGHVADILVAGFEDLRPEDIGDVHAAALDKAVDGWFRSEAVTRRHFIPCVMTPYAAKPISVGPVTFIHVSQFSSHPLGMPDSDVLDGLTLDLMRDAMTERTATWVAVIDVDGFVPSRSSEMADLAVDVAIGALQLIIHPGMSRRMARVTARTLPPWRGSFVVADGRLSPTIDNLQPGRQLPGSELDTMMEKAAGLPAAAGRCLTAFLYGEGPFSKLRLAWCDAVYWFHEGLAEPLDSLAVAKMETAVEVLLRAESSKNSGTRMKEALRVLTGLAPEDVIDRESGMNMKQFAERLVGMRSRVLHGTVSTLLGDLAPERGDLTAVVHSLLVTFAVCLEVYVLDAAAEDDIRVFLGWLARRREEASRSAPVGV